MPIENMLFAWLWVGLFALAIYSGYRIENNGRKYNDGVMAVFVILYLIIGWAPAAALSYAIFCIVKFLFEMT